LWFKPYAYDLLEIIPGFIVGLTLTVLVSHITAGKSTKTTEQSA
jgi:hypothetical protein